jgi:quinol monooxygenase YgiN
MIVVAGTAKLQSGARERADALIATVVTATRQEAGCASYTFYTEVGDPNTIHVFEEWESEKALVDHLAQPHTQAFLGAIGELLAAPPDIRRYDVTAVSKLI